MTRRWVGLWVACCLTGAPGCSPSHSRETGGLSASPDAGAGAPETDAGSPSVDAGTIVSLPDGGVVTPPPTDGGITDGCQGLRPGKLGPPVRYFTAPSATEDVCSIGTSDGNGNVLLTGTFKLQAATNGTFLDSTGKVYGTDSVSYEPFGQASGFVGQVQVSVEEWLESWTSDGGFVAMTPDNGPPRPVETGDDPTGGIVSVTDEATYNGPSPETLRAYDAQLHERWNAALPPDMVAQLVAADRAGAVLVIGFYPASKRFEGLWFAHDGTPGSTFELASLPSVMTPRVGSGFFLSDNGWPGHSWSLQVDSGSATPQPAPAWLTARPNTNLHMAFGGKAYVVMPLPASAPVTPCAQTLEVVAPNGTSCGTTQLKISDRSCTPVDVSVGYDGTVIQTYPTTELSCDPSGNNCNCGWQYWPGFYGHPGG